MILSFQISHIKHIIKILQFHYLPKRVNTKGVNKEEPKEGCLWIMMTWALRQGEGICYSESNWQNRGLAFNYSKISWCILGALSLLRNQPPSMFGYVIGFVKAALTNTKQNLPEQRRAKSSEVLGLVMLALTLWECFYESPYKHPLIVASFSNQPSLFEQFSSPTKELCQSHCCYDRVPGTE